MKSIILCEGVTDLALVQYFMETTYHWIYIEEKNYTNYPEIDRNNIRSNKNQQIKWFKKDDDFFAIYSVGGVSRIHNALNVVMDINRYRQEQDEPFKKIIIITDRDEANSVIDFDAKINKVLNDNGISKAVLFNDEWTPCSYQTLFTGESSNVEILLLVIPFEETGALETFLLDALSKKDDTDKKVIQQGNNFIDNLDHDNKYLTKNRHKTKAKFDVYFSIRTPVEQFAQRRSILRSINWEEYEEIQNSFKKLGDLS